MAARFGRVLNWAALLFAAVFAIASGLMFISDNPDRVITGGFLAFVAVLIFLIGSASKYVLAGD